MASSHRLALSFGLPVFFVTQMMTGCETASPLLPPAEPDVLSDSNAGTQAQTRGDAALGGETLSEAGTTVPESPEMQTPSEAIAGGNPPNDMVVGGFTGGISGSDAGGGSSAAAGSFAGGGYQGGQPSADGGGFMSGGLAGGFTHHDLGGVAGEEMGTGDGMSMPLPELISGGNDVDDTVPTGGVEMGGWSMSYAGVISSSDEGVGGLAAGEDGGNDEQISSTGGSTTNLDDPSGGGAPGNVDGTNRGGADSSGQFSHNGGTDDIIGGLEIPTDVDGASAGDGSSNDGQDTTLTCADDNGGCDQICLVSAGGPECACDAGYSLNVDGQSCDDIDECRDVDCGPGGICSHREGELVAGQYRCDCEIGSEGGGINRPCQLSVRCRDDLCGPNQICFVQDDAIQCTCEPGYGHTAAPGSPLCPGSGFAERIDDGRALDLDTGETVARNDPRADLFQDGQLFVANGATHVRLDVPDPPCEPADGRDYGVEPLDIEDALNGPVFVCIRTAAGHHFMYYPEAFFEGDQLAASIPYDAQHCVVIDGPPGALECEPIDPCASVFCGRGGQCVSPDNINNLAGYTCECEPGYAAPAEGMPCEDIDECADVNCGPGAICRQEEGELNPGRYACRCALGTTGGGFNTPCVDTVNECELDPCDDNQACFDEQGYARCACKTGYIPQIEPEVVACGEPGSATLRDRGLAMDFETGRLVDPSDDTADLRRDRDFYVVNGALQVRANNPSEACGPADQRQYSDQAIDGSDGRTRTLFICLRTSEGNYYLYRPLDFDFAVPVEYAPNYCPFLRGELQCVDIDECEGVDCGEGQVCREADGETDAGRYTCVCQPGYTLTDDGAGCVDIDECADADCGAGGTCIEADGEPTPGRYTCQCAAGYEVNSSNGGCVDIDECKNVDCGVGGTCIDEVGELTPGRYRCQCAAGYSNESDLESVCVDIDECAGVDCGLGGVCSEEEGETIAGTYTCICPVGTSNQGPGTLCEDTIDECDNTICGANQSCINEAGNGRCQCDDGYAEQERLNPAQCGASATVDVIDNGLALDLETGLLVPKQDPTADLYRNLSLFVLNGASHARVAGPDSFCGPGDGHEYVQASIAGTDGETQNLFVCIRTQDGHFYRYQPLDYAQVTPIQYEALFCADPANIIQCIDIDECAGADCGPGGTCTQAEGETEAGRYTCVCAPGTTGGGIKSPCADTIDECADAVCGYNQVCVDQIDAAECQCKVGFEPEPQPERAPCGETGQVSYGQNGLSLDFESGVFLPQADVRSDLLRTNGFQPINGALQVRAEGIDSVCGPGDGRAYSPDGIDDADAAFGTLVVCLKTAEGHYYLYQPQGWTVEQLLVFVPSTCADLEPALECIDVNECEGVDCGEGRVCSHAEGETQPGKYSCECAPGYSSIDPDGTCVDIDECQGVDCGPGGLCRQATGETVPGRFTCDCFPGSAGGGENTPCVDAVNECDTEPCGPGTACIDEPGRARCECAPGYQPQDPNRPTDCNDLGLVDLTDGTNAVDLETGATVAWDDPRADLRRNVSLFAVNGATHVRVNQGRESDCGPNDGRTYSDDAILGQDGRPQTLYTCLRTAEGNYYLIRPLDWKPTVSVVYVSKVCASPCEDIDECAGVDCGPGGVCLDAEGETVDGRFVCLCPEGGGGGINTPCNN